MPNPLLAVPLGTKSKPVDRTVPIQPVPEEHEGYNRPYIGIVDHGVDVESPYRQTEEDMPDHDGRLVAVYEEEEKATEPIPVYIVNQSSRERRAFRTIVDYAGQSPSRILGQDESRTAATILNPSDTITVYIADMAEAASVMNGWPLAPGQSYRTETQEDVYAYADNADPVLLRVAVEFRRSLDG